MNTTEPIPHDDALEKAKSLSSHPDETPAPRRGRALRKPRKSRAPQKPEAEPRRPNSPLGGACSLPGIGAPIERQWEALVHLSARLSAWERAFVKDMGHPKWWRGSRLHITSRQQAMLAKIYAALRRQIAAG